jgi:hypothetical protein
MALSPHKSHNIGWCTNRQPLPRLVLLDSIHYSIPTSTYSLLENLIGVLALSSGFLWYSRSLIKCLASTCSKRNPPYKPSLAHTLSPFPSLLMDITKLLRLQWRYLTSIHDQFCVSKSSFIVRRERYSQSKCSSEIETLLSSSHTLSHQKFQRYSPT